MEALTNALSNADDDYLTGLSNKGTVKRAYKDLEQSEPSVQYTEHTAEVSISGETCSIVLPLGDSICTCQSRSMCRHRIAAMIWLKKNNGESQEKKELSQEFVDELTAYPLSKIQKAMKKRYYTSFIQNMEQGVLPEIEETSILSVSMPNEDIHVRLVFPLNYSTCSCHSKELCKHKAAAILAWQIKRKIYSLEQIKISEEMMTHLDVSAIHHTSQIVKDFLVDILSNGLVRISDDIAERARDLSVMCHCVNLANSEKLMRELGNRLDEYVKHSSAFYIDRLVSIIMENMDLTNKILKTKEEKELYGYAGEFKSTYVANSNLSLIPVAQRKFISTTGYEGDIYYFFNKNNKESKNPKENTFLSYSNIRPRFYENGKSPVLYNAPWGFEGSMDEMMESEICLKNPKLSKGKISSSKDSIAEVIKKADLNQDIVREVIYTDFKKMIEDVFINIADSNAEGERLVMISPKKCISSKFDEITQSHNIVVEDYFERRITIRAKYNSNNKNFFAQIQKIGDLMKDNIKQGYVIFANIYIEKGNCYLYPIAVFDHIEVPQPLEESINDDVAEWGFFSELFLEIQKLLYDMTQCGINSFDFYDQIKDYAVECQRAGLLVLGDMLIQLYNLLKAKNHTYHNENEEIVSVFSDVYQYLSVGIQKTEVEQAVYHLYYNK